MEIRVEIAFGVIGREHEIDIIVWGWELYHLRQ